MYCQTPHVSIPNTFDSWESSASSTSSTKYPVHQRNDLTLVTADEALDFYIGFKLDGVRAYKNLSDTKYAFPYGKITYYTIQPQIRVMDFETFIPYSGRKINIQVSY